MGRSARYARSPCRLTRQDAGKHRSVSAFCLLLRPRAGGPVPAAVNGPQDGQAPVRKRVRDDVGRSGHLLLASALYPTRTADRVLSQQRDRRVDAVGHQGRRPAVVLCEAKDSGIEILQRVIGPGDRSQASSCARSIVARPCRIASLMRCHPSGLPVGETAFDALDDRQFALDVVGDGFAREVGRAAARLPGEAAEPVLGGLRQPDGCGRAGHREIGQLRALMRKVAPKPRGITLSQVRRDPCRTSRRRRPDVHAGISPCRRRREVRQTRPDARIDPGVPRSGAMNSK